MKNPAPSKSVAKTWLTPWRFAAILGALIVVSFPQVVAGFETFVFQDYGQFAYPVASYHRDAFWHGEIPLWNPLSNCGTPFLAQWNTLTLYPLSLFYLIFPISWSFGVFCLGHLWIGGMGMYFLVRRWTGNNIPAAVSGTAYAFNGLTWFGIMWPHLNGGLAWMPWVVMTVDRSWREGGRMVVLAVFVGTMQMLSGGVEVIIQTWLLLGVLWAVEFFRAEIPRRHLLVRGPMVVVLIAALAAAQLLPFLDFLNHSQRGSGFGSSTVVAMPLGGWANYLVPMFHCTITNQGVLWQTGQGLTGSYYLGAGIAALAMLAIWRVRNHRVCLLAGLTLFSLTMAWGGRGPIYDIAKRIVPLLGFLRFPAKFLLLPTFTITLLTAYGVNWLLGLPAEIWPREWRKVRIFVAGVLALMTVILGIAWKFPLPTDDFAATLRNTLVRGVFLVLVFGCLVWLRRETEFKLQRLCQICLVLFVWFDVFTHAPTLSPTVARAMLQPDLIRKNFNWDKQLMPGTTRASQSRSSFWRMLSEATPNIEIDTSARRLSLAMNYNLLDHAAKFDGFYSLELREFSDVFKYVRFGTNQAAGLQDFLAISHTNDRTNDFDWVTRPGAMSLITTGQQPVFADSATTLRAIDADNFDPRHEVYLPLEARPQVTATNVQTAKVLSTEFASAKVGVEAESPAPAMLVVAQAFYHPWHAYVDGAPTPLWCANYAFQALEVPAGKHHVSLVYEDRAFYWGVILSVATLVGLVAALGLYNHKSR